MNIFNRTVLIQEPNPEAAAKVWSALRKAGIQYKVVIKSTSTKSSPMLRTDKNGTVIQPSNKEIKKIYIDKVHIFH